jgi:hypothetical protein
MKDELQSMREKGLIKHQDFLVLDLYESKRSRSIMTVKEPVSLTALSLFEKKDHRNPTMPQPARSQTTDLTSCCRFVIIIINFFSRLKSFEARGRAGT